MFTNKLNQRYYSHARVALFHLLANLNLKNDTVLVPEFICRELLSGLNELNATIKFYSVDNQLLPILPPHSWPNAGIVIAVNYFGHAQPLEPFIEYCQENGALLVEDNAHGLFSKDPHGELLGTRGDFGIFSLRKTFPLSFGAMLRINNKQYLHADYGEVKSSLQMNIDPRLLKYLLSPLPLWDRYLRGILQQTIRGLRGAFGRDRLNTPTSDAEFNLPSRQSYSILCRYFMEYIDRRKIFRLSRDKASVIRSILDHYEIEPIFVIEDTNTIPYGIPFICHDQVTANNLTTKLATYGYDCVKWPDLPEEIYKHIDADHFYNHCYWVPFDWWSKHV